MIQMNINEIFKYLPHRYPFLLVDKVISLEKSKNIVALKNVTINEPFFSGHFPHHPVMPGALIVEALAQAAGLLTIFSAEAVSTSEMVYYFVGIDDVRFKKPVTAGDQLILKVTLEREIKGIWKYSARAEVDSQLVTKAKLLCTAKKV